MTQSWASHSALTDTPFPASDMISVLKGHWLLPGERMIGRALVEGGRPSTPVEKSWNRASEGSR